MVHQTQDTYSDEAIRRALNTPPQPNPTKNPKPVKADEEPKSPNQ